MTTRKLGFKPLGDAVYDRIDNHVLTSTYRIYNAGNVPDRVTWPYIAFKIMMGNISDSFTCRTSEAETNIVLFDFWSDYAGDLEVSQMMDNVIQAMTSSALVISGYDNSYIIFLDHAEILDDETDSGKPVKHGIVRVRVEMAPT